jgi:hypothetical protein
MELIGYDRPSSRCGSGGIGGHGKTIFRDTTKAAVAAITATLESGFTITVYRCPEGLHLTRNLWGPWNRALLAEYGIEREAA